MFSAPEEEGHFSGFSIKYPRIAFVSAVRQEANEAVSIPHPSLKPHNSPLMRNILSPFCR